MTDRQLAEKMAEALERFVAHYPHGINPELDAAWSDARKALAAFREAHPTPTTPCTSSSQDPN